MNGSCKDVPAPPRRGTREQSLSEGRGGQRFPDRTIKATRLQGMGQEVGGEGQGRSDRQNPGTTGNETSALYLENSGNLPTAVFGA